MESCPSKSFLAKKKTRSATHKQGCNKGCNPQVQPHTRVQPTSKGVTRCNPQTRRCNPRTGGATHDQCVQPGKNHFHQNHFHQKKFSSETTFIKNQFHQRPLSSETLSSNTLIRNNYHHKSHCRRTRQNTLGCQKQYSPCLCESVPGRRPTAFTEARLMPAFWVSTGLHVEHRRLRV